MKPIKIIGSLLAILFAVVGITFLAQPEVLHGLVENIEPVILSLGHSCSVDGYSLATGPLVIAFAKQIEENLFPANEFYMRSQDDSLWVNHDQVKYPVAGAKPGVQMNRSVLPAPIEGREDDENNYFLQEFTTDPTLLKYSEELLVNYNKRESILRGHRETLDEKIANYFANLWYPNGSDNIVRTTGTVRAAASSGATGTRKGIAKADLIKGIEILNRMNAPKAGRCLLIAPEHLSDLLAIDDFVHADKLGTASKLTEGAIGRVLGLEVYERSYTAAYDNAGTPVKKALGAVGAASDNAAALIWQESMVTRAKGGVEVFYNPRKAEYYGDLFSALVRAGGKTRKDKKGIVALVEAHG
jgi:hypothetical protein